VLVEIDQLKQYSSSSNYQIHTVSEEKKAKVAQKQGDNNFCPAENLKRCCYYYQVRV
jgi:hypothetical protein